MSDCEVSKMEEYMSQPENQPPSVEELIEGLRNDDNNTVADKLESQAATVKELKGENEDLIKEVDELGIPTTNDCVLEIQNKEIEYQAKEIERLKGALEIWKSQLTYIKDKHSELHQDEIRAEKCGEQYLGEKFSNDVICVWEVAIHNEGNLNPTKENK